MFFALSGSSSAQADVTYSGRAYAAYINLPVLGSSLDPTLDVTDSYIADTGPLPSSGGFRKAALFEAAVPGVLSAGVLVARTSGANGVAESSASLAEVTVLPGQAAQVTASFVRAQSEATCSGTRGSTDVANVTFGPLNVEVTGAPNQRVDLPGVATLTINEQTTSTSAGTQEITVNALHLKLATGDEVILSSAHSDIKGCPGCPPVPACDDFVTGGGWITANGGQANFGFNAGLKAGSSTPEVHFNYIDHAGMKVKATSITRYARGATSASRIFEGEAEVNGAPGHTYRIEVADNGEPGRRTDSLKITLSYNNYSAGGTLEGGNIQLHRPCP
ncbi:MAG TPA: choice-of-anchor P family protein [bacterium]|nr:choice-of-anchor P family protein [bacterium]